MSETKVQSFDGEIKNALVAEQYFQVWLQNIRNADLS